MDKWLFDVFHSRDFWISFTVAVIFFFSGTLWKSLVQIIVQIRQSNDKYSISGFWIGTCSLPSYKGVVHIEIWQLVQIGERVKMMFFAYPENSDEILLAYGAGVFRTNILSAIYYSASSDNPESGALALRLRGKKLVGSYAQFDNVDPDQKLFVSDDTYEIRRIKLPILSKIKMRLGYPPVASIEDAKLILTNSKQSN